jgi:lipase maturation factor 1
MKNVSQKPKKPVLIYDGDCGFCRLWIARWSPVTEEEVDYHPSQKVGESYPQIPPEHFESSVYFVSPDGNFCSGAQAVFKTLAYAPNGKWFLRAYEGLPGFAPISEWSYRQVAQNRKFFSVLTRYIWGASLEVPTWFLTRRVFLFLLGLTYMLAFLSLWTQIEGLVGQKGILPVEAYLKEVRLHWGPDRFWNLPTLFWLNAEDKFLQLICLLGAGASLLVMVHRAVLLSLFLMWGFYLSLFHVAQPFLGFQWDTLLLETGFLALFLVPWGRQSAEGREAPPSTLVLFLFRFLLFRVVFSSGLVKIISQDSTWNDFTALYYYYETQPLPTWIGWYAHQLPHGFQEFSVACVFIIQLGAVFLIFGPGRIRYLGCATLIFHEVLILLTGNYCFFNLLTIALCLLLLDDAVFSRWFLKSKKVPEQKETKQGSVLRKSFSIGLGAGVLGVSIMLYVVPLASTQYPSVYISVANAIRPLHLFNSYGLFAVMTTSRPEIIVLGSEDRENWFPYEFKWKPGDIARKPEFVAPHQPRLDWQMWFAALSNYERNPWLIRFMIRLLQGSPPVIALLDKNPFPENPPRYLQAVVYDYRFTDSDTRSREGSWWNRKLLRPYTPILQLPE